MKGIKSILIQLTYEEYKIAIKYKDTHNKPTWKEMMLDYITIKNSMDKIESKEYKGI